MTTKSNPWGITPREGEVMDALLDVGYQKLISSRLGIGPSTVDEYVRKVKKRMGARHQIIAAVMWDRYRRGHEA